MDKICTVCNSKFSSNFPQAKVCSKACSKVYKKNKKTTWNKVNRERKRLTSLTWSKANPEKYKAIQNKWNLTHPDRVITSASKCYQLNPEKYKIRSQIYRKENPGVRNAFTAQRRAIEFNATVSGYKEEIKAIYIEAKNLQKSDGIKRHVHHVIPLQELNHLGIFGLHVPWNLEILTEEEHREAHRKLKSFYFSTQIEDSSDSTIE